MVKNARFSEGLPAEGFSRRSGGGWAGGRRGRGLSAKSLQSLARGEVSAVLAQSEFVLVPRCRQVAARFQDPTHVVPDLSIIRRQSHCLALGLVRFLQLSFFEEDPRQRVEDRPALRPPEGLA